MQDFKLNHQVIGRNSKQTQADRPPVNEASPGPAWPAVAQMYVVLKNCDLYNEDSHNRKGTVKRALEDEKVPSTLDIGEHLVKAVPDHKEGHDRTEKEAKYWVDHARKFSLHSGVPDPGRLVDDVVLGLAESCENSKTTHRRTNCQHKAPKENDLRNFEPLSLEPLHGVNHDHRSDDHGR